MPRIALAALSVLISGITLYLAAEMGDLWAIWEIAWTGAIAAPKV